jgi:anti-sigma regulatory factor (Ser/Thr protein kinase)
MDPLVDTEPFVHPALFYRDEQEYLEGTVPFVRAALDAGEPVAVAVPGPNLKLIRAALGAGAEAGTGRVRFLDMTRVGRNPGNIIPGVLRAFADAHPDRPVRIIGEPIWAGRSDTEYPACAQHEALINAAFHGRDATILCPYDAEALDEQVLNDAHATHPVVIHEGRQWPSPVYDAGGVVAQYNRPLPPAPASAVERSFAAGGLAAARHFATGQAALLGLTGARLEDLALAVAELTTNSVVHGGGTGRVRIWAEDEHVVCEVGDSGCLSDPLAGRVPPARDQQGGRGLLLVNHLADLVRYHTTPQHGTAIRCYVTR